MDVQTILIAAAGIVATGSLSKAGANITDSVLLKTKQLLSYIQNKLPHLATVLKKNEQPINYGQIYLEIEAVASQDVKMQKLLQEMKEAVLSDREVARVVEQKLNNANPQLSTVIENWNGINIKGGNNSISGNTFNF